MCLHVVGESRWSSGQVLIRFILPLLLFPRMVQYGSAHHGYFHTRICSIEPELNTHFRAAILGRFRFCLHREWHVSFVYLSAVSQYLCVDSLYQCCSCLNLVGSLASDGPWHFTGSNVVWMTTCFDISPPVLHCRMKFYFSVCFLPESCFQPIHSWIGFFPVEYRLEQGIWRRIIIRRSSHHRPSDLAVIRLVTGFKCIGCAGYRLQIGVLYWL